jgi:benzoyl-CoA 2,3-dioxygenase component B
MPHRRFHRQIGAYGDHHFNPRGELISEDQMNKSAGDWLPSAEDRAYIKSLMYAVDEPGQIANWIAPPKSGVKGKPFEFEYVRKD